MWGLGALQHCMPPHFPNDVLTVKECRTLSGTSHEIKSKQLTANSFPKGLLWVLSFFCFLVLQQQAQNKNQNLISHLSESDRCEIVVLIFFCLLLITYTKRVGSISHSPRPRSLQKSISQTENAPERLAWSHVTLKMERRRPSNCTKLGPKRVPSSNL